MTPTAQLQKKDQMLDMTIDGIEPNKNNLHLHQVGGMILSSMS